jgi:hypothetical protein
MAKKKEVITQETLTIKVKVPRAMIEEKNARERYLAEIKSHVEKLPNVSVTSVAF